MAHGIEIPGALWLVKGPSLMDLQEALLFNQTKEMWFYAADYHDPIGFKLSGMLHQNGKLVQCVTPVHWLLLGYVTEAKIPGRPLSGKQVSVNYAPQERAGFLRENPALKMRGGKIHW